jgi:hypothetical protein
VEVVDQLVSALQRARKWMSAAPVWMYTNVLVLAVLAVRKSVPVPVNK